jgi:hypothetical protein
MTTLERENALDTEKACYNGEIYAFERVERMLKDRKETLNAILRKQREPRGDHPCVQRSLEIGMFLDEIHILKRQVVEAYNEALTK